MSEEQKNKGFDFQFAVFGVILILIGFILLLGNVFSFLSVGMLWPLFMMIPVLIFIPLLAQDFKSNYGVLVPTGILTFLTVYFIWLNFTSWSNVAETWPNFILSPAVGLFLLFLAKRTRELLIPVFILTTVAVVSYAMIFRSNMIIGICFFLGGAALLVSSFGFRRKNS